MIISYAKPDDVPEIAALWVRMVKELAPDYTPRRDWWEDMAVALLKTDIYHLCTAQVDGHLVGFIDGFLYPEPSTGQLHAVGQHFYVLPDYRQTSIAARLYREAIRFAHARQASVLEFFCFDEQKSSWLNKGYKPVRTMLRRPLCSTLYQQ